MKNKVLVAVYGTLRLGHNNYKTFLKDSKHLGTFRTEPIYTMFSLGAFPAIIETNRSATSITMDVFEIDNENTAKQLDNLEGYIGEGKNNLYNKDIIPTPWGNAFVYLAGNRIDLKNLPIVDSGDWNDQSMINKVHKIVDEV